MKKILFVITKSNWGGAQRYVFDLATGLDRERFDVAVALGGTGAADADTGLLHKRLKEAGVRTLVVHAFMRDISLRKEFGALGELYKTFKTEKPDIVHLNSSKAGGLGALAARMAGVPRIIFTAHGWPFWEQRGTFARAAMWFFSWLTALLCHKVIVISNYDLAIAKRMRFVSRKLVRIYNGIGPIEFGSGEIIRNAFPPGTKVVGTVGELNANKNQIALVETARQNPDTHVAIVGGGELREFLENKIKEDGLESRVKMFGFIPAKDVLRGFDIFALPSKKEGLPYVLLEAKQAGLPIEANRVGGVPEILDAKDMGEFTLERMVARTQEVYLS